MKITNYLKKIDENRDDGTEHTFRTNLENYLNSKKLNENIKIHQELKKVEGQEGTPDFTVIEEKSYKKLVGYIECKKLDFNLENVVNSEQIKKYTSSSKNILITNYIDFWLLDNGKVVHKVSIHDEANFKNMLYDFLKYEYLPIETYSELVSKLANNTYILSKTLKDYISNSNFTKHKFYRSFNALYNQYKESLQYSYSLEEFCDVYSQSLVYGLFIKVIDNFTFDEDEKDPIIRIPEQYKLLREFLDSGYNKFYPPKIITMTISAIMRNLNLMNIEKIIKTWSKDDKEDLIVYLYESYLKEYDNVLAKNYKDYSEDKRKSGGVYYTPKSVTNFITASVETILKESLNAENGYLSHNVKILDFATGTGTFLLSILDIMLNIENNKEIVKNKILNDIYGFELLFTPYIVAHTNLERKMLKKGIKLKDEERFGIYLTNTLDLGQNTISDLLPFLQDETEKANEIKNSNNLLVVVGNPPYSNKSKHSDKKITELLLNYKKGLTDKKINLDDDYIKFIRFAQKKIDDSGYGVFGTITNNSFLDGLTHRKMRESLLSTFDEIYIINLHGNSLKKDGDKNVFDIMVGVSITIFVKRKRSLKRKIVKYFSTLDNHIISREEKFEFLNSNHLKNLDFANLKPKEPNFWFVEKDESGLKQYSKFTSVTEIFDIYGSGLQTDRDKFIIDYDSKKLEKRLRKGFRGNYDDEFKKEFQIQNTSSYKFETKLKEQSFEKQYIKTIIYRPFDKRYIYYKVGFTSRPAFPIMKNILNYDNLGLVFVKQIAENIGFSHTFVVNEISDRRTMLSNRGAGYTAPLYKYIENMGEIEKIPNFTKKFQDFLQTLDFSPTPEEILSYIYARLHSNRFRKKYFEFLKTDFPKVPFTENKNEFFQFAKLGEKLVNLHIMKSELDDDEVEVKLDVKLDKNLFVEKIVFDSENETLWINDSFYILGVSQEIWDFEIGSYKVLDKWLKYRKKDKVEVENFEHLEQIVIVIKQTLEIMAEIDLL